MKIHTIIVYTFQDIIRIILNILRHYFTEWVDILNVNVSAHICSRHRLLYIKKRAIPLLLSHEYTVSLCSTVALYFIVLEVCNKLVSCLQYSVSATFTNTLVIWQTKKSKHLTTFLNGFINYVQYIIIFVIGNTKKQ